MQSARLLLLRPPNQNGAGVGAVAGAIATKDPESPQLNQLPPRRFRAASLLAGPVEPVMRLRADPARHPSTCSLMKQLLPVLPRAVPFRRSPSTLLRTSAGPASRAATVTQVSPLASACSKCSF